MREDRALTPMFDMLSSFSPAFTRRSFDTFRVLLIGWILCPGRHTLSRVIQAASGLWQTPKHHATLYRFFSRGRWCVDELGKILLRLALRLTGPEVVVLVDDTLAHRSGPHLFGAGMHHDALRSTYASRGSRSVSFAFGHNWVVLAVVVTPPWETTRRHAIPFLFRLYRPKKRTPAQHYRKRTELARELVEIAIDALPEAHSLHLVGDSEYACKTLIRALPHDVHFTGPLPMDAALYEVPGAYRGRGRPAKRGRRLPNPKKLAQARSIPWRRRKVQIYGREVRIDTKTLTCQWYSVAGTRTVRGVLTRDPSGRLDDRAYFSTDIRRSAKDVLRTYAWRWEIEVAFRNTKQTIGLQDAQNGWWRSAAGTPKRKKRPGPNPKGTRGQPAVEHTLPFAFVAYAFVLIWYFEHGTPSRDVRRARDEAPWYGHKATPSFADMLVAFRREVWKCRLSGIAGQRTDVPENHPMLAGWALAA